MSSEARTAVTQYYHALDRHDVKMLYDCISEDFAYSMPGVTISGRQRYCDACADWFQAMPDLSHDIQRWIVDGNHVAVEAVFHGTTVAPLGTLTDNFSSQEVGRHVSIATASIFCVTDEKVQSRNNYFDYADFVRQLGAQ